MPKSKKLQNKKPLFNVVAIYGVAAVGKFTVANELYKLIDYKFFHNHHTHDMVRQLFRRGEIHSARLIENIRFLIFKEIAEAKINVVTTHAYESTFVSQTGLTDDMYMKKIESIITKKGGRLCFVHLIADDKEILKRVTGKSRKNFMKLMDKDIMKKILKENDCRTSAPVKNNLQIDNTKLSPKKVAEIIKKHFEL
jgi:gluconate kinase